MVAPKEVKRLPLTAKPRQIQLEITVPRGATRGSNYLLEIEQVIDGVVTGGYTTAITVGR